MSTELIPTVLNGCPVTTLPRDLLTSMAYPLLDISAHDKFRHFLAPPLAICEQQCYGRTVLSREALLADLRHQIHSWIHTNYLPREIPEERRHIPCAQIVVLCTEHPMIVKEALQGMTSQSWVDQLDQVFLIQPDAASEPLLQYGFPHRPRVRILQPNEIMRSANADTYDQLVLLQSAHHSSVYGD